MQELRAFKYRIYPSNAQKSLLAQFFGAKRWIFNHYLAENQRRHKEGEKFLSNFDINKNITHLKRDSETAWLKGIDSIALQNASEDLSLAFTNFFNSIKGKRKGKKVDVPRFKNRDGRQSYRTRGAKIDFEGGIIRLPKIKDVKCVFHRPFTGTVKSTTVSKDPDGRYYVSVLVETNIDLLPATGKEVGFDLGLKDLLILSTGHKFHHPEQMLAKAKRVLKREQRKLARKVKGSTNRAHQRTKVAKAYSKITRIRNDYYHNISKYLVNNFDAIYMEDLNVAGMVKNHCLARKISESAWSTLKTMIEYKATSAGKTFHQVGRFFASSKTCSHCEHKMAAMSLSVRAWKCESCGHDHDRDLNAAVNIRNQGQIDCYGSTIFSRATSEMGEIPTALKKHVSKIERSGHTSGLHGDQASPETLVTG